MAATVESRAEGAEMAQSLPSLLARNTLLRELPPEELEQIARRMQRAERRSCTPGEVIIKQGHPGERCYLILDGQVAVTYRHDPESPSQVPIQLATLEVGEFFGEMALMDGLPSSATVTTLEPTCLLALTQDELLELLLQHPRVALSMLTTISRRLRGTEAMLPVPKRPNDLPELSRAILPW